MHKASAQGCLNELCNSLREACLGQICKDVHRTSHLKVRKFT